MALRHVVTWKMAAEDPKERAEHAAGVASRLQALVGVVPSIRSLSTGVNSLAIDGNWDVTLVADFDDAEGLDAYQVHPAHQEVVAYVRSVVGGRSAVDFEV
ncbi:Dabb family protein [Microbacterium capsulatum]|uniref:Dabb family protein n=1 Tax=Microbacterium capsulatum TaxID=3041921 RepID=A0ABU0XM04_9MICO|nr:Dabb family protein [Microbacterium sp. ASV81]MDQ4215644.1 Dabb family protein [Microbacterium sp. ASV81]